MHQVLIASEPILNESSKGSQLLIEHPMPPPEKPFREPTSEPKPRGRSRKNVAEIRIKGVPNSLGKRARTDEFDEAREPRARVPVIRTRSQWMRIEDSQDPRLVPRTDRLGGTTGESPNGLVRPAHEVAKSLTETSSEVREPLTYDEAMDDPIHGNRWREAIDKELWNLDTHQTWTYKTLPPRRKAIGCKWVFRVKYKPDGSIERYKARLVAQCFSQIHGVDYTETFAPTIRRELLRILLAFVNMLGLILMQMDVVGAYLKSALGQNEQPIFMNIRQGRQTGREGLVCKILKSFYGLKQAGRLWNKTIIKFFKKIGFDATNGDPCILIFRKEEQLIMVGVYVDDLMLASNQHDAMKWVKEQLFDEFTIKDLGEAKVIIEWEITKDLEAKILKIDQKVYIRDLLESEGMSSCHPTILPILYPDGSRRRRRRSRSRLIPTISWQTNVSGMWNKA